MIAWTPADTWIVVIAATAAMACALVGNFLVLRRMSMMGDAISHAVLPGLALAFLWTGSRAGGVMFVGAVLAGVLTAILVQAVHRAGRVEEGASMGVVFTALFAVGLILMRRVEHSGAVDLDADCVLYGALELTPLRPLEWGGEAVVLLGQTIPSAFAVLAGAFAANLLIVALLFKEFRLVSFDPQLATALGFGADRMHYLLMAMTAVTCVAAFESVGAILVVAMLVAPPAAARLLTDRLWPMIAVSLSLAVAAATLGHLGALTLPRLMGYPDTTSAGMVAAAAGGLFLSATLFSPRQGVVAKSIARRRLARRVDREDLLGTLWRREEQGTPIVRSPLDRRGRHAVLGLVRRGWVSRRHDRDITLTAEGREQARGLLRRHRMWETYLADEAGVRPDHTHATAERLEHVTDSELGRRLSQKVDDTRPDPQGQPIPPDTASTPDPIPPR